MAENFEKNEERLINNVLEQAKYFLEDADEFYPFGASITKNELRPMSAYDGNEYPKSVDLIRHVRKLNQKKIGYWGNYWCCDWS